MSVELVNQTSAKINQALVQRVAKAFLKHYNCSDQSLAVIIVSDKTIRALNKSYRRLDKVTDVLSFAESDSDIADQESLGEVFIDYRQIKRQAKIFGHSVDYELVFILVHGMLHLLGYDDQTEAEAKEMEELGTAFIKQKIKLSK